MNYSNGYDLDRAMPIIMARKGWTQPTVSTFTPVLSTDVTACVSGMPYNLDHQSCSPNGVWLTQEDAGITEDNFNAFMVALKRQVALESLMAVFPQMTITEEPKILFEKQFRTSYKPIPNASKFCGWQLKVSDGSYSTKIESIGLTMSKACTVTLYLYNDIKADPLWTHAFNVTVPNSQTIFNLDDLYLSRLTDDHKGGVFYIGYYQDEIAGQADTEGVDVYLNAWESYYMVGYQGFEAASNYDDKTFQRDNYFSNFRTYGLNLELSTFVDYTNVIIRQAQQFDRLQGLLMTKKCMELAMNSPRTNGSERISREMYETMYNELEGLKGGEGIPYRQGLKDKIMNEVKRLQKSFYDDSEIETAIPPIVSNWNYSNDPRWGNKSI